MTPLMTWRPRASRRSGRVTLRAEPGRLDRREPTVADGDVQSRPAVWRDDDAALHDQIEVLLHGPPMMAPLYTRWVARRFRFRQVDVFTDTPLWATRSRSSSIAEGLTDDGDAGARARDERVGDGFVLPPTPAGAAAGASLPAAHLHARRGAAVRGSSVRRHRVAARRRGPHPADGPRHMVRQETVSGSCVCPRVAMPAAPRIRRRDDRPTVTWTGTSASTRTRWRSCARRWRSPNRNRLAERRSPARGPPPGHLDRAAAPGGAVLTVRC